MLSSYTIPTKEQFLLNKINVNISYKSQLPNCIKEYAAIYYVFEFEYYIVSSILWSTADISFSEK